MKQLQVVFVLVAVLIAVSSAHFLVYVPQTFQAELYTLISGHGQQIQYKGYIRYDSMRLHRRITMTDDWSQTVDTIYRFDLQKQYAIYNGRCTSSVAYRTESDWFAWIAQGQYLGVRTINNVNCDFYQLQVLSNPSTELNACVVGTTPVYYRVASGSTEQQYYFYNVIVQSQPDEYFQIPPNCPALPFDEEASSL